MSPIFPALWALSPVWIDISPLVLAPASPDLNATAPEIPLSALPDCISIDPVFSADKLSAERIAKLPEVAVADVPDTKTTDPPLALVLSPACTIISLVTPLDAPPTILIAPEISLAVPDPTLIFPVDPSAELPELNEISPLPALPASDASLTCPELPVDALPEDTATDPPVEPALDPAVKTIVAPGED